MRTPLTAILGAATALGAQYDQLSDEQVQQLISSIEAESFHMVTSSENVLSMVKLKSIASLPDPLPWQSPIEIIEATVRRYELRRNQKRFAVESPPDPPLLQADAMLLSQALANLIDNAISVHLSEEPIVIQVESESQHDFMIIRMSVLDRGPGFPEGFTPQDIRAFEIPKRAAPNQSVHKGFGLGLTIVQAIVSLHRGQLSIQAREGGGAVVSMVFQSQSPSVEHHVL
jgi:two-component system sensor histidine kinase KdpD